MDIPELVVVKRKDWGARPPLQEAPPLGHAIKYVVATLNTDTPPCNSSEECEKAVREIQRRHMDDQGLEDIQYNFLFGGDGKVYEGRGWKRRSCPLLPNPPGCPEGKRRLDFAYIGDWRTHRNPPTIMVFPVLSMVQLGIEKQYLSSTYRYFDIDYQYIKTEEDIAMEKAKYEPPRPEEDFSKEFNEDQSKQV